MFLTSPALSSVKHGFFGRTGGVSQGVFDSLNCGLSNADDPAHVRENRARAMTALGTNNLTTLYQIHSADVVTVTAPIPAETRPRADAAVTNVPGVTLGVLTADCVPVLFADPVHRVIGAAHSGWKGTAGNIGPKTIAEMEKLGAKRADIVAVIGPCIAQESYEVGPEFPERFPAAFFSPSPRENRFLFDLGACVMMQLVEAGLGHVSRLPHDTCRESDTFFSNRRNFLGKLDGFGLQLSAICLD